VWIEKKSDNWVQRPYKFGIFHVANPDFDDSRWFSMSINSLWKILAMRTHRCPHCGLVLDRDLNASLDRLRLVLRSLGPESVEAYVLQKWEQSPAGNHNCFYSVRQYPSEASGECTPWTETGMWMN